MGQRSMAMVFSGLLFLGVYFCGFFLSAGKPLWLDEHHSMTRSIAGVSYGQILQGRLDWEGNNAPLFYLLQKSVCDLVAYDPGVLVPVSPSQGMLFYGDPFSNVFLRLIPLFFMALAPAILFYYFSRRYSWVWGGFSALLCLSSWLLWWYGLEARPYIHFLTLSLLQVVAFLEVARSRDADGRLWWGLGVVNVLLALTVTASILQVALIAVWFAGFSRRSLNTCKIIFVFLLPALIAAYYYAVALKGRSWFSVPIYKYYLSNVPWHILAVSAAFFVYAGLSWSWGHKRIFPFLQWMSRDEIKKVWPAVFFFVSLSAVYFLALAFFKMRELPVAEGGAPFANRHLINFVPVGIIAMTIFSRALFQSFKDVQTRGFFTALLVALLAWRFIYTYFYVHSWINI